MISQLTKAVRASCNRYTGTKTCVYPKCTCDDHPPPVIGGFNAGIEASAKFVDDIGGLLVCEPADISGELRRLKKGFIYISPLTEARE